MEKSTKPELVVSANEVTRVSEGAIIKGDLSSVNDIRLDGNVEGTIFSKSKIVVGEKSHIKGALVCSNADFSGELEGDIYVGETLLLKNGARVSGNIHANKFQVEMGAQINGSCKMITKEEYEKECSNVVKTQVASKPAPAAK